MKEMDYTDYSKMTQEEFDEILREIVRKGVDVLSVPGVHEILAEHFNNEVLDVWAAKQKEPTLCGFTSSTSYDHIHECTLETHVGVLHPCGACGAEILEITLVTE